MLAKIKTMLMESIPVDNTVTKLDINEAQLKSLAKNLRFLLNKSGQSENDVAQALQIPVMTIRRLVSGETTDPRISTLRLIADYFNISIDALIETKNIQSIALMKKNSPQLVPVLDWLTASQINTLADCNLNDWQYWQPVALNSPHTLSEHAFALESRPSMQPRFPLGTLFIIDPIESPTDGDIVLIKMQNSGDVSLRELVIDPPNWQLKPIITGSDLLFYDKQQHRIAGVVVLTILQTRNNKYAN